MIDLVAPDVTERPRILLTGANGQVGGALLPLLRPFAEVVAPDRNELDLTDYAALRDFVRTVKPHCIINPAAYTAVDKAESEPELARAINTNAVEVFGQEAVRCNAAVIHFSTDYVFDGIGNQPWKESDLTNPLSVYGATKLAGERALASTGVAHLIFRTSWVFGRKGKNFLLSMLKLGKDRSELRVVADQHGAPTSAHDLAELVLRVLNQAQTAHAALGTTLPDFVKERQGVYHAASAGETTWFGFAQEIFKLAATVDPDSQWAQVTPISSSEYPTPARRPKNSRLNCSRLSDELGLALPSWQNATAQVMKELFASHSR